MKQKKEQNKGKCKSSLISSRFQGLPWTKESKQQTCPLKKKDQRSHECRFPFLRWQNSLKQLGESIQYNAI